MKIDRTLTIENGKTRKKCIGVTIGNIILRDMRGSMISNYLVLIKHNSGNYSTRSCNSRKHAFNILRDAIKSQQDAEITASMQ